MLVLDASALASWLMPDEVGTDLAALAEAHDSFCAPWLLWAEIRNILIVGERRGRIPAASRPTDPAGSQAPQRRP